MTLYKLFLLLMFLPFAANADENNAPITTCASGVFADALEQSAYMISEDAETYVIEDWIHQVFYDNETAARILECPEFMSAADNDRIRLTPVQYTFPNGRDIVVNYETQPRILKQRQLLLTKRSLPSTNPNPEIGAQDDDAIWTNTDPAWYGIMVVESGSMDEFIGPEKNNTISLKYIEENIDRFYPKGYMCTSRSAWAGNNLAINKATHNAVDMPDDTNDYYVAGDINLEWVGYAEVAADVILTVATMGGYGAVLGATKSARAARAFKNISKVYHNLGNLPDVIKYRNKLDDVARATKRIDDLKDSAENIRKTSKMPRKLTPQQQKRIADIEKNIERTENQLRSNNLSPAKRKDLNNKLKRYKQEQTKFNKDFGGDVTLSTADKATELNKIDDEIKALEKQNKDWADDLKKMEKESGDVQKYKETKAAITDLNKYINTLRGIKPQTGNVIARGVSMVKGARAIFRGGDKITKAAKIGRVGKRAERARDFLFHSTLGSAGALAKVGVQGSALLGAIGTVVGFLYDFTDSSTDEFTNDVQFRPLLLLSADDLKGYEDTVNYGMWLLWMGDSTSAADDNAAYLQAMDFASKFHQDLYAYQNESNSPCNVDIYVVRPILRNPGTDNAELFFLVMNDTPWSTN
jgi:predicted  nucleic acid-binding Zn-ribbon protein